MLSFFNTPANHPKLLDRVMETKEVSKLGAYQFKLYVEGKWTSVLIDSRVPCVKSTGKIAFTTASKQLKLLNALKVLTPIVCNNFK